MLAQIKGWTDGEKADELVKENKSASETGIAQEQERTDFTQDE
jgi:hypothetical protein